MITEIKVYVTGNIDGAYWHSIMQFGVIFLENSSHSANIYIYIKCKIIELG